MYTRQTCLVVVGFVSLCAAVSLASQDAMYARKSSWAQTMIAAKAQVAQAARREDADVDDLVKTMWAKVAADFPRQAGLFRGDTFFIFRPSGLWFMETSTHTTANILRQVIGKTGVAAEILHNQYDQLEKANTGLDDCRWLDLYIRACNARQCAQHVQRIWITDLRRTFEAKMVALADKECDPEDARWAGLASIITRIAEVPGWKCDVADLADSLETLKKTDPGKFDGAGKLLEQLARQGGHWQEALAAVAAGQESAVKDFPTMAKEIQEFQQAMLRISPVLSQFLSRPENAGLADEWHDQFAALEADIENRNAIAARKDDASRPESLIAETDRDPLDIVLRRTSALLDDLKRTSAAGRLAGLEGELAGLQAAAKAMDVKHAAARYVLYAEACRVRRQIAFTNPLLNFDELLFAKHHRALYGHMCDQYYGAAARPGGGLYVMSDPFGPGRKIRDVLANSTVSNGRLKGQKLTGGPNRNYNIIFDGLGNVRGEEAQGGSFLSPELSYDGKSILFAYVECKGEGMHNNHTDPTRGHWAEGRCYHIFRVNVDGSNLQQLTDGTWNDFDPCLLPNGRIAFISERRGGYLRCGRVCPTFTLYDMAADGADIRCLSFHETNEWHPTVAHDGKIAWTRWDYIDRHFSAAHMPWTTTPDGCDPRPIHGNYAWKRHRPDMEMSLKAIPDSTKFVATAAPHHGQAYGSLILIDPQVKDDDAGAPLKRLTPEIGYPETGESGTETYATPWPLSEDYFLCVYDSNTRLENLYRLGGYAKANYGIYLVDSFGNKELIYRDPDISCLKPIPLTPRERPPVMASNIKKPADGMPAEATVSVLNVYDSLKPWPTGVKIKALRVWQIIPQSVPAARNMGMQILHTGSLNIGRYVLGTVPVEEDGSAHFIAPAKRQLFFQALDENGLAVQSMRSGTHFQPGEELSCQGCHEPKHRAPLILKAMPMALKRPPARLQPDVDGTNPFSYPRLVQPVLDKHCVQCHANNADKAPRLDSGIMVMKGLAYMDFNTRYFASYVSLAPQFGFYDYGVGEGRSHRTTPGQFGALGSRLYPMLLAGHHDVKLPPDDLHRITVWLDSCSLFYGVYEREAGEAQLRGEVVKPTLE